MMAHCARISLVTTYHTTSIESKTLNCCPAEGAVIWATLALTAGVISDSRATVEMIRAFEVNRILYREYFVCEKLVGLGETKDANAGDYKY